MQLPNLTGYTFPLAPDQKPGFGHALRDALRNREVADLVSANRRNGLPRRQDFAGVQNGILHTENRKLSLVLPDYEKGVLLQIVSGAVRTRERMFRHRRRNLASDPYCALQQCSNAQVLETRRHRFWICPQ